MVRETANGYFVPRTENAYNRTREVLSERYGYPFVIAEAFRTKLDSWQKIYSRDCKELHRFSDFLLQCKVAMEDNFELCILNESWEIRKVLMKLPEWITNRLGWITTKARSIMWRYPSFSNFADFSAEEAEIECDPNISLTFAQYAPERDAKLKTNRFGANVLLVSTHSEDKFSSGLCQLCQQKDRSLQNCRTFSGKDM